MYRSIFSLCLIIIGTGCYGQDTVSQVQVDTVIVNGSAVSQDTITKSGEKKVGKFIPTHFKIGYNMVALGSTIFSTRDWQEGVVGLGFNRYYLLFEYGQQQSFRGDGYRYENSGSYHRIGGEINLLKNDKQGNQINFGLRYAKSTYRDEIWLSMPDTAFFGAQDLHFENNQLTARWWELSLGLNVKVWKDLVFGYTLRYKLFNKRSTPGALDPYEIPGYGKYGIVNAIGFDYYICWHIPSSKKKEGPERISD